MAKKIGDAAGGIQDLVRFCHAVMMTYNPESHHLIDEAGEMFFGLLRTILANRGLPPEHNLTWIANEDLGPEEEKSLEECREFMRRNWP